MVKKDEDEDEDSPLNSLPSDFKNEIEERFNELKPAPRSRRALIKSIKITEYKANKEEEENNKKSDSNSNKDKRLIKKRKRNTIIPRQYKYNYINKILTEFITRYFTKKIINSNK
jgi:Fe2+ transport system protein B